MGEIAKFVHSGASRITPKTLRGLHKKLPMLKLEFTGLNDPKFPHLVEQLEFLTDVVEDFIEGADDDLTYAAVTSAAFAVGYAHRQVDLIPDTSVEFAHADESAVVRAVLIEHERVLSDYAVRHKLNWSKISIKP